MAGFDYDVVVIGSGFGGSVAAFRAAEKGYRAGAMESGRRWNGEDIPKVNWNLTHFLWQPEAAGSSAQPRPSGQLDRLPAALGRPRSRPVDLCRRQVRQASEL